MLHVFLESLQTGMSKFHIVLVFSGNYRLHLVLDIDGLSVAFSSAG